MKKAIVLTSGGLDSTTALGIALSQGRACYPLGFDYAQRHRRELQAASKVVAHYAAKKANIMTQYVVRIQGLDFSASALTNPLLELPKDREEEVMSSEIPVTYVPARNSIFLAIATAFAETLGADEVWTGFNAVDYSGYPDCRPAYVHAMEGALALGTKRGVDGNPVRIVAPIITDTKAEIVKKALELGVPLEETWSCYAGESKPCGSCDSCRIRAAAFTVNGCLDPALTGAA